MIPPTLPVSQRRQGHQMVLRAHTCTQAQGHVTTTLGRATPVSDNPMQHGGPLQPLGRLNLYVSLGSMDSTLVGERLRTRTQETPNPLSIALQTHQSRTTGVRIPQGKEVLSL